MLRASIVVLFVYDDVVIAAVHTPPDALLPTQEEWMKVAQHPTGRHSGDALVLVEWGAYDAAYVGPDP